MAGAMTLSSSNGLKSQVKFRAPVASLSSRRLQVSAPKHPPKTAVKPSKFQSELFAAKPTSSFASSLVDTIVDSAARAIRKLNIECGIECNAKNSSGNTLQGTNLKRIRESGFRARMATKNGRRVITARRRKGRKVLGTASRKFRK